MWRPRTSAKRLSKLLSQSNNRLVVMHDSKPEMLLVGLKELKEKLEEVCDNAIVMERKNGIRSRMSLIVRPLAA